MPVLFNLRHLQEKDLHLQGDLPAEELDAAGMDELIKVAEPVRYDLRVEKLGQSILVHGTVHATLECDCARCLTPFQEEVDLSEWACNLPLEGEEKVRVENDFVDLTPYIREDILLAFPQHPLCKPECSGLPSAPQNESQRGSGASQIGDVPSAWAELDKLRFKD